MIGKRDKVLSLCLSLIIFFQEDKEKALQPNQNVPTDGDFAAYNEICAAY